MTQKMRRPAPAGMEYWISDTNQLMTVHHRDRCSGRCAIHNPSDTYMSSMRRHWREDEGFMERICDHAVGHPDPDQIRFWEMLYSPDRVRVMSEHGCDGCCDYRQSNVIDGEIIVHEIKNPRKEIGS